jgi:hypothetical protein
MTSRPHDHGVGVGADGRGEQRREDDETYLPQELGLGWPIWMSRGMLLRQKNQILMPSLFHSRVRARAEEQEEMVRLTMIAP